MSRFNPADFQNLNKMNKNLLQTRYDAVVSLKNAFKNSADEILSLKSKMLEFKSEVDALTSSTTVDSTKRDQYNQEIHRRLETLSTIEKFTAYPLPYGHEVRYFNGDNKEQQIRVTVNYYPKGIYKGTINYHLCHVAAFDIYNQDTVRSIRINKLDPLDSKSYYDYQLSLINIIDSTLTSTNSVSSGTTTQFTVSSDPTNIYIVGNNLFLQNGTNLGIITATSSTSITISSGTKYAISAGDKLYKEGNTPTNLDTSKILERNADQLANAYNFFNYNCKTLENSIDKIVEIAKQLSITLNL